MPILDWTNREQDLTQAARTPYRLLKPVASQSVGQGSENMLIEGDNLEALKALRPYIGGQVKCVFIDPPYNTNKDFDAYKDSLKHSQWLSMMYPRLELLRDLLSADGSIWITLDDNEAHYFKVIADEIFHRENFVADIIWQHSVQGKNDAKGVSLHHNHLFVYRKSQKFVMGRVARTDENNVNYANKDNDPRGPWRAGDVRSPNMRVNLKYPVRTPSGKIIEPPEKGWRWSEKLFWEKVETGEIVFLDNDTRVLRKIYLEDQGGRVPESVWFGHDVGTTRDASNHLKALLPFIAPFPTPKPEGLIQRILNVATEPGDFVLDSFLGSGTTAAVAHKMGRRWVGVEMGEHARSYCIPRLKTVVAGEQGGISKDVGWEGGGGFTFYTLGERMFDDNEQINPAIGFAALASHIIFSETGKATTQRQFDTPLIGEHEGSAYYLLYNGILGEKSAKGGNVLTKAVLKGLPPFDGPKIIYGEACLIPEEQHEDLGIVFRMTPYSIKGR